VTMQPKEEEEDLKIFLESSPSADIALEVA